MALKQNSLKLYIDFYIKYCYTANGFMKVSKMNLTIFFLENSFSILHNFSQYKILIKLISKIFFERFFKSLIFYLYIHTKLNCYI